MGFLRRVLGISVMIAGILGLLLALAGLAGVWIIKPTITKAVDSTVTTLTSAIDTSTNAMGIAGDTLTAAVTSVEALSDMLANTAATVEDTQPVITQLNAVIGEVLPASIESASQSLQTAQQAAGVLDDTIKSLDTFRMLLSATPLLGSMVQTGETYNPEVPLADSLGDLADELLDLPDTFSEMAENIDKTDDNLVTIQDNLTTMSTSIGQIATSLSDYQAMVEQSQSSLTNVKNMLTGLQTNQGKIFNGAAIVFSLFFLWLLVAQIVIFSQGWELYQGTAGRMESNQPDEPAGEPTGKSSTGPEAAEAENPPAAAEEQS